MSYTVQAFVKEKALGGFYYLASPYSHDDPGMREARNIQIGSVADYLLSNGLFVYSPIWAAHNCCTTYDLPTDNEWWRDFNLAFLTRAEGLIVVQMQGWRTSKGVANEMKIAKEINRPFYYLDIDDYILD